MNQYQQAILGLYQIFYYASGQFGTYSNEFTMKQIEQIAKNILLDYELKDRERRDEAEKQRKNDK